jgi:hypothetical protein
MPAPWRLCEIELHLCICIKLDRGVGGGYNNGLEGNSVVWCGVVWCGVVWCGVVWCHLASDRAKLKLGTPGHHNITRGDSIR